MKVSKIKERDASVRSGGEQSNSTERAIKKFGRMSIVKGTRHLLKITQLTRCSWGVSWTKWKREHWTSASKRKAEATR